MTSPVSPPADRSKLRLEDPAGRRVFGRLLRDLVRPHTGRLLLATLFMALVAATTAATAWLMDPVVNKVFIDRDAGLLWLVGLGVAGTFLLKSIASYAQEAILAHVGQRIIADTQNRLFSHLIRHDLAMVQAHNSGQLMSRFTYDINAMRLAVSNALVGIGRDTLSVIFLVGVMIYQEWMLAAIALVVAPLTILPLQKLAKRLRKVSFQTQDQMGVLNSLLAQSFQGLRMIKAFRLEQHEEAKIGALVEEINSLSNRAARARAAAQPIIDSFGGIAVAAVIIYGGIRVIDGATSAGAFFSFITAVMMAYQPMRALGKVAPTLQEGLAAAERVFDLLDRQPAITSPPGAPDLPRQSAEVRFDAVDFSYDGARPALQAASFTAPAGQITALVGPSGAGKSTLFALLSRFYEVGGGRITIGGQDIRHVSLSSLRDAVAIVSQDVVLFDDTIANNIRFGCLDADDAAVTAAARAAAADSFIRDLPQGYDTPVGERGFRLSGGQRQRIAIARALLKDAPILLLDEATSALDTESERQIQDALAHLMQGRTTLVIAHRLSTIRDADIIHVFDQGRVAESGNHDHLLRCGGVYSRLHALQFADTASADPAGVSR